jgi:hypothetical protein
MTATENPRWDLNDAIQLLNSLSFPNPSFSSAVERDPSDNHARVQGPPTGNSLGDFSQLWAFLGRPQQLDKETADELAKYQIDDEEVTDIDLSQLNKAVRWRDEVDGADLEDNVEPVNNKATAAYLRNQKRASRRAKAKEKAAQLELELAQKTVSDTTDRESGEELESLRRSPDRRAVIQSILGRPRPELPDNSSPPTSPSPPFAKTRSTPREWPVSNPFVWAVSPSPSKHASIAPRDNFTPRERKQALITELIRQHPEEKRYLKNVGLLETAFTPLNTSSIGIHVFVDISNISIGFHDCLKVARGMARETRLRRVPLSFHNFSLVLERGRPAAKRTLVGSDKHAAIQQAELIGYETNILERVHKAKELTPRQKKFQSRSGGETSGSETNPGFPVGQEKWVEQGVDEILHLKILESLVDAKKPGTMVLATGDAAEAEYSGGFLRMVERALQNGWHVELVSFRLNTSNMYKRKDFRSRWGQMFKLIELDTYVEYLIDGEQGDG